MYFELAQNINSFSIAIKNSLRRFGHILTAQTQDVGEYLKPIRNGARFWKFYKKLFPFGELYYEH